MSPQTPSEASAETRARLMELAVIASHVNEDLSTPENRAAAFFAVLLRADAEPRTPNPQAHAALVALVEGLRLVRPPTGEWAYLRGHDAAIDEVLGVLRRSLAAAPAQGTGAQVNVPTNGCASYDDPRTWATGVSPARDICRCGHRDTIHRHGTDACGSCDCASWQPTPPPLPPPAVLPEPVDVEALLAEWANRAALCDSRVERSVYRTVVKELAALRRVSPQEGGQQP